MTNPWLATGICIASGLWLRGGVALVSEQLPADSLWRQVQEYLSVDLLGAKG